MLGVLTGLVGAIVLFAVAFLMSNDKKNVNYKAVGIMAVLQIFSTWLLLGNSVGLKVIDTISAGFTKLSDYAFDGINFVVGGWIPDGGSPFFISVLLLIVFTSTLLSILTHLKVLPYTIKYLGKAVSKITGLPQVESFNAVNNIFFGQTDALLAIKGHLSNLPKNRLFIVCTSAMASVSASIVASYTALIPAKYVLVALILNMFSGLMIASVVAPVKKEEVENEEVNIDELVQTKNIFDAIGQGALDGGKCALIIAAMLIAYLGLLAMLNNIMFALVGVDLTTVFSYVFAPIAFLMGVPASEILTAGSVMGTKLIANEFVAIMQFQPLIADLSSKTVGIISTYLISFSAFGSIGIIAGSLQAINGAKAKEVSSFGLKMLLVATMASILSGTVVGFFL